MAELQIPPSINDTRGQALLQLIERLAAIDLTPLLVYRLDSVPAGVLPFLAWQFDILSPLWQLMAPVSESVDALTDIDALIDIDTLTESPNEATQNATSAAQRALLKMAIPLHRCRGTPGAIKSALASLGWTNVTLVEGEKSWGGNVYPPSQGWAVFRVLINLVAGQAVESGASEPLIAAINFFKPARAWLDSVWFVVPPFVDAAPTPFDVLTLGGLAEYGVDTVPPPSDARLTIRITEPGMAESYGPCAPRYNAHYRHSGITYGANEPAVADSALILNGQAVIHGG